MANFFYRLRDANSTTETPIILVGTFNGLRIKCKTEKSILPSDWDFQNPEQKQNGGEEYPKTGKKYSDLTKRLVFLKGLAEKNYAHFTETLDKVPTSIEFQNRFYKLTGLIKDLKEHTKQPEKVTLFSFITNFISEAKYKENVKTGRPISDLTIGTYKQCERFLKLFNDKKRRIDFEDIDLNFYYQFKEFLVSKKLSPNTISKHIKTLKTFLNDATDRDINTNLKFKSKKFSAPQVDGDAIYLSVDELDELYNLDLTNNLRLEKTRDLFLIGCYTGLRYGDWAKVRLENIRGENIELITQKTNSRATIPMPQNLKNILIKYKGTPPEMTNQKMNLYIKEVGEILVNNKLEDNSKKNSLGLSVVIDTDKYKRLGTHTARRSFATNLYLEGIPSQTIMKITTHTTEKNFLKYIRMTNNDAAETIGKHYKNKEAQKINSLTKVV